jgi:hypothetical protein
MDITRDTLLPYIEYMTVSQRERYRDYVSHGNVKKPFSWNEIYELERQRFQQNAH